MERFLLLIGLKKDSQIFKNIIFIYNFCLTLLQCTIILYYQVYIIDAFTMKVIYGESTQNLISLLNESATLRTIFKLYYENKIDRVEWKRQLLRVKPLFNDFDFQYLDKTNVNLLRYENFMRRHFAYTYRKNYTDCR